MEWGYRPILEVPEVDAGRRRRVLVSGRVSPELCTDAEVRVTDGLPPNFPEGVCWHDDGDTARFLIVVDGDDPASSEQYSCQPSESSVAGAGMDWFEHLWPGAESIPSPKYRVDDLLTHVPDGEDATVRRITWGGREWQYTVRILQTTTTVPEKSLAPITLDDEASDWVLKPPSPAADFAAMLTRSKLNDKYTDVVFSFGASRTIFRAYQFKPVLKYLATGADRMLIADEVGLGKTIEAGLFWTELEARGMANRVFVICPAGLVEKWQREMVERFGFELKRFDQQTRQDLLNDARANRTTRRFSYVCSTESMRGWEGIEELSDLGFTCDLVIIDEAHSMRNVGTLTQAMGQAVADWTAAMVLLSATPLNLGNRDLFALVNILSQDEFAHHGEFENQIAHNRHLYELVTSLRRADPDRLRFVKGLEQSPRGPALVRQPTFQRLKELVQAPVLSAEQRAEATRICAALNGLSSVVTRTRKVEVTEDRTIREPVDQEVTWTEVERDLYDAHLRWLRNRCLHLNHPPGFATQMPLRMAGSCLPVVRDRILGVARDGWADEDSNLTEDLLDPYPPDSDLVAAARRLGAVDTKFDALEGLVLKLQASGHQALIFTFSRQVAHYLHRRLRDRVRAATLHGGIRPADRGQVMANFRSGDYDVLIATRVASEGLDFEFCSVVVNYDLPWNPMEVEQRIGRVDRIGQQSEKVFIHNFHTPGTIESDIVMRNLVRIDLFRHSIGEIEPILESEWLTTYVRDLTDFTLTDEQRAARAQSSAEALAQKRFDTQAVESAQQYLLSADGQQVEGLADRLHANGRYVGHGELLSLVVAYIRQAGGRASLDTAGEVLSVTGNDTVLTHLQQVAIDQQREPVEVRDLQRDFRNEQPVYVALTPEVARTRGLALLSPQHPLVLAAARVAGHREARFAVVGVQATPDVRPGDYLVLFSSVEWRGLQPVKELRSHCVDLATLRPVVTPVGDRILAALADATVADGWFRSDQRLLQRALSRAQQTRDREVQDEGERRGAENDLAVDARLMSLSESEQRRLAVLDLTLQTAASRGTELRVTRMTEGRRARLKDEMVRKRDQLEQARRAKGISHRDIGMCVVTVR